MAARPETILQEVLRALDDGDAAAATEAISRPAAFGPRRAKEIWDAFLRLLHRRGFYVSSPAELARSLEEIRTVGAGFDLYELACALARRGRAATRRLFGELEGFGGNGQVSR